MSTILALRVRLETPFQIVQDIHERTSTDGTRDFEGNEINVI